MASSLPSTRWYRLSLALVAAGALSSAAWWVHASIQIQHAVNDFARTRSPFGGTVVIDEGVHTLWIEGGCLSCPRNSAEEYREAATVTVEGPGGPVELEPAPPRVFNTGGDEGRALWVFTTPEAGEHRLTLSFDTSGAWDNALPARIAIGEGVGLPVRIVRPMATMAAAGLLSALTWAAVLRWRRQRWFRANER